MQHRYSITKCFSILIIISLAILSGKSATEDSYSNFKNLKFIQPYYPLQAQRCGIEGFVIVEFTITETGEIENIKTVEGMCGDLNDPDLLKPCFTFNESALSAAAQLQYRPAERNGIPVKVDNVMHRYLFKIERDNKVRTILNMPAKDLRKIERLISKNQLDKAEKISLSLLPTNIDINYLLGKIYLQKNEDELAIKHFKIFLDVVADLDPRKRWKSERVTYETFAIALLSEKLFALNNYKGIIELAPFMTNAGLIVDYTESYKNKQSQSTILELPMYYLGVSYLLEGEINLGFDALVWVQERTKNESLQKSISGYLSQVKAAS
jgi:TonB family protein